MPEYFTVLPDRAEFRPVGRFALPVLVRMVSESIAHAGLLGAKRLLIVGTGVEEMARPTDMDRVFIGQDWARANSGNALRIALVIPQHLIHPQKLGLLVAANRGLTGEVFAEEEAALACLLYTSPSPRDQRGSRMPSSA